MPKVARRKPRHYSRRFRKEHVKLFRTISCLDRSTQKIGEILKVFQLDCINHIVDKDKHILERLLWLFVMLVFGFGVFYLCWAQWARYKANPTVISLERDYRSYNGTMPAVSLCYSNKFNRSKVEEFVERKWGVAADDANFGYLSRFVVTIANMTLDTMYNLFDYANDDRLRDTNLRELVEFVYPNDEHVIRSFDEDFSLDSRLILTERGMCHTINAPISKILSKNSVHSDDEFAETLTCFMYNKQCFMKLDFYSSTNISATIELHSPEEVPVYDSFVSQVPSHGEITIIYQTTETLASDSLRSLDFQQRKCVFRNEMFDENPKFNGKLCEMDCRAQDAIKLCNCKPFFYPFIDAPECKINGYLCLYQNKWPMRTLDSCKCPPSCNYHFYIERSKSLRDWQSDNVLLMSKSSIRWEIKTAKFRNRRDVIFSFADFIVSFGGAAALLFGVNFLHCVIICLKIIEKIFQILSNHNLLKFPRKPTSGMGKVTGWFNYFSTARGRVFSYRLMGAVSVGVSTIFCLYQTFFIDNYLNFIRVYRNGLPLEVPEEMELMVDAAADRVKLEVREATHLKTFMVTGFDVTSVGSLNSMYNGWVGIPVNYLYKSTSDIDRFNIKLRTESIDWNSKYGEQLQQSLILTDDEKLFGLIRSVLELKNYNHIHSTIVPGGTIIGLYASAQAINKRYNLFKLPKAARVFIYGLLTVFAYGVYTFVTDTIRIQQTARVDKAMAALGADICEVGIHFYEKILNKNIALNKLSGKDLYSVKGNEYPGWFRFNTFPLTTRKLFFEQSLQKNQKQGTDEKDVNENMTKL